MTEGGSPVDPDHDPFDSNWTDDPLGHDSWQLSDDWPQVPSPELEVEDDHSASPFSVAAATMAGSSAIRALRSRLRRGRQEPAPAVATEPPATPAAAATAPATPLSSRPVRPREDDASVSERTTLIALCVELDDLISNEAHRQKLRRGLRGVGVEVVDPLHELFDPDLHCAVGTERAPAPNDDRRIARVERVGFVDRGHEVRLPDVIVYRDEGAGAQTRGDESGDDAG